MPLRAFMQEPTLTQTELDYLNAELKKLDVHKHHLLHDQLPTLCRQVAALQDSAVLQQDYTAKLLRQDHTRAKKQEVIDLLIEQRARQQLLHLVREEEVKKLQGTKQELQLLHELLSDVRSASQQRMAQYGQKELQLQTEPQHVVHDNDSFLQTLNKLLPDSETDPAAMSHQSKLYVTFEQLAQKLSMLNDNASASNAVQLQAKKMQSGAVASMHAAFAKLHPAAFPDPESDIPQLTTPELQEAMELAQSASQDLTSTVNQVAQKQQQHQVILQQQHEQLNAERSVFSIFHNEPEKLKFFATT